MTSLRIPWPRIPGLIGLATSRGTSSPDFVSTLTEGAITRYGAPARRRRKICGEGDEGSTTWSQMVPNRRIGSHRVCPYVTGSMCVGAPPGFELGMEALQGPPRRFLATAGAGIIAENDTC